MTEDLSALAAELRSSGGDTAAVEVKAAMGGLPQSLTATLSALANLPGGGLIVLGLDERTGFRPVPLADPQLLKQGLAAKARSYAPPVRITITDGSVDGAPVVVGRVAECDRSAKPCRVRSTGKAYLRGHDGDFEMSEVEEQAFLAQRSAPHFDRRPVDGATIDDLDRSLVGSWSATVRERDPRGLGRFTDDNELLRRGGVMTAGGQPTVAGIIALGVHPQQWYPRYVIQAAADTGANDPAGTRARNPVTITGPLPQMLDETLAWARRTFDTSIVTDPDGSVHDRFAYPLDAFRELIANALIHRDLDDWSEGHAIEVRLRHDRLVITNPGGLYGITVARLGQEAVTSARNARLVALCQHVRTETGSARVVEALATGIPIVTKSLSDAGMPPPRFIDAGIQFTVVLHQRPPAVTEARLGATELRVYDALAGGPRSVAQLESELALSGPNIRKSLRSLRAQRLVNQIGGRGQPTTYERPPE